MLEKKPGLYREKLIELNQLKHRYDSYWYIVAIGFPLLMSLNKASLISMVALYVVFLIFRAKTGDRILKIEQFFDENLSRATQETEMEEPNSIISPSHSTRIVSKRVPA